MAEFRFTSFLGRWIVSLALVAVSFNPTGWSYYHWVAGDREAMLPLKVLAGLLLAAGFVIFLRASIRSLGALGLLLTGAVLAALIWLFVDLEWLDLANSEVLAWVALLVVATILAVGVSWSHIRRRISGQMDMDDLDE